MQTERIVWPSVARGNQEQDANRELGGGGASGKGRYESYRHSISTSENHGNNNIEN